MHVLVFANSPTFNLLLNLTAFEFLIMENIRVIAFDADDTLWVNEPNFREAEEKFCELLNEYMDKDTLTKELFITEMANLHLYGYGVKGFVLCMIETIIRITQHKADASLIQKVMDMGKELLQKPVELLEGVREVLIKLNGSYRLVVATKGDLLDQERKLAKSGLEKHFHHIEIMSGKSTNDYIKLLKSLNCNPENFLMIGNSLKSDVIPVLELGGYAVYVPFHTTWIHEELDGKIENQRFFEVKNISEILKYLS